MGLTIEELQREEELEVRYLERAEAVAARLGEALLEGLGADGTERTNSLRLLDQERRRCEQAVHDASEAHSSLERATEVPAGVALSGAIGAIMSPGIIPRVRGHLAEKLDVLRSAVMGGAVTAVAAHEQLRSVLAESHAQVERLRNELARLTSECESRFAALSPRERDRIAWDAALRNGRPGREDLRKFPGSLAGDFERAASREIQLLEGELFDALLLVQLPRCERLLGQVFWTRASDLAPDLLQGSDLGAKEKAKFEEYVSGKTLPSLGVTCQWIVLYRRALAAGRHSAVKWTEATFTPTVGRHGGERRLVHPLLVQKGLVTFLNWVKDSLRNPLAHGNELHLTRALYAEWCDRAYATGSLRQWVQVGTHPGAHASSNVGWISLIAAAWRGGEPA